MARVNVEVDESLVENARMLIGATTKWETVEFALRRLVGTSRLFRPSQSTDTTDARRDPEPRKPR